MPGSQVMHPVEVPKEEGIVPDEAHNLETSQNACPLGGLPLSLAEVRRHLGKAVRSAQQPGGLHGGCRWAGMIHLHPVPATRRSGLRVPEPVSGGRQQEGSLG